MLQLMLWLTCSCKKKCSLLLPSSGHLYSNRVSAVTFARGLWIPAISLPPTSPHCFFFFVEKLPRLDWEFSSTRKS